MSGHSSCWFALRVRTHGEKLVSSCLASKGYETFLPTQERQQRFLDRVKNVERPLFPGYVFCKFPIEDKSVPIVTTPGVLCIVGNGKSPVAIPDYEIDSLKTVTNRNIPVQPYPFPALGTTTKIAQGPLAGVEGTVVRHKNRDRLVLSIPLLSRAVCIEISAGWVRPAESRRALAAVASI